MTRSPLGSVTIWYGILGGRIAAESGVSTVRAPQARNRMARRSVSRVICMDELSQGFYARSVRLQPDLPAQQSEPDHREIPRSHLEHNRVDATLPGHKQLERTAFAVDPNAAFRPDSRLGATVATSVDAEQTQVHVQ